MTDTTPLQPAAKPGLSRILEVLLQPVRTFALIAEESRASWQMPMLVLSASTFLSVMVSGYLTSRAAMMGEMPLPRDWQWWSPEMQENYMRAQQAMQGPVFAYIIPLFTALAGLWLGWLILSGLLHLGSTIFGGRGSMQTALTVAGWANLPFLVRDILRIIFMLATGGAIQYPGLSGFSGDSEFITQLLARFDIFLVWNCVLLVIGFIAADKLSKTRAAAIILSVVILLLLAQAAIGAAFAGLGGLGVQRPFF